MPDEVERERGVILQEIGQANDTPDDIIFDHFQEAAYPGQPMGRPVLGTEERIRAMPREALMGYMRATTRTANMVVAAAGNLEHEAVLDLVERHFADLPRTARAAGAARRSTRAASSARTRDLDQVHIVLGFPSVGYGEPDFYPAMLLSTLLGGGMSSRLFQEMREKRGLVYSIYSFTAPYADGGLFAHLCRHRRERGGGADAGDAGGAAQGAARGDRGRAGAGAGAGEGRAADVAGKHRQPLRAAGAADPGVRPGDPDRRDGGDDRGGDHRRHRSAPPRGCSAARRRWRRSGRPGMCPGCRRLPGGWRLESTDPAPSPTPSREGTESEGSRPHGVRMNDLTFADLIARARAAGADAADAVLVAGTSLSVQRRLGRIEHLERSEGRDLGLRVFVGQRQARCRPPPSIPPGSPCWPSGRWRWRGWCRRTPMPVSPSAPRRRPTPPPWMIRKCVEAVERGCSEIVCWGDGSATREFLYVEDCADGILSATGQYDKPEPVNLGTGCEICIRDLAGKIAMLTGFHGRIVWDTSRPNGQPRRCLGCHSCGAGVGFRARTISMKAFGDGGLLPGSHRTAACV